ncbi:hypothetical protein PILCRDRAFT_66167 [Piloderma croceum F 1598]|uniref:Complex 1 LYR protein domain-containing protein n=1 Tax=Piloderma croceum (strain F 1598) TaxID=765440 RepID=A0A0C3FMS4_PILCF|nr:hypothetical protein PILCRDRAFT_66167 [Piloderma croceum F 1598]
MQRLTLKHFILKQRVLDLYRHAIRSSRSIQDPQARKETMLFVRSEFERHRAIYDVALIEDKIAVGRREFRRYFP